MSEDRSGAEARRDHQALSEDRSGAEARSDHQALSEDRSGAEARSDHQALSSGEARWPVALITGASSGIGRALAVQLASEGSDLVVVARSRDELEALAEEVGDGGGRRVEVLPADLTDPDELAAVEARLADPDRPVDLLVNNAGFGTAGPFLELSVEGEEAEIRLNVVALVRLTRAAVPGMVERGRGAVLNMSSLAALQPLPYSATYAATKAYVTSFSHALHEELRGTGVQVLALMPGFTRTNFQARSGNERSTIPGPLWMSAEAVAAEGLAALARGRVAYVPGARYRVVAAISRMTPWALTRRVVAAVEQRSYRSSN